MSRSSHRLIYFQTGLHFNQVIASLQPYTNYSFKVVVNGSGGSAESAWQNVTTPQDSEILELINSTNNHLLPFARFCTNQGQYYFASLYSRETVRLFCVESEYCVSQK